MPYYRRDGRLIHHVEIPKTGTKSIEALLISHGWKKDLLLLDKMKSKNPSLGNHAHYDLYGQLNVEPEFEFTTVRHPVSRWISTIYFLRSQWSKGLGGIPDQVPDPNDIMPHHFITFMHSVFTRLIPEKGIHVEHNMYLQQFRFIGEKTKVFKIESGGFDSLLESLRSSDIIAEKSLVPKINASVDGNFDKKSPDWNYAPQVSQYFCDFYKKDFEIFDYEMPEFKGKK